MDPSANKVTSLRKLCEAVLPNPDAGYEIVQSVPPGTTNETQTTQRTCEKIHTRLSEVSAQDADKFKSLYPKINNSIPTTAEPSSSKSTAETASCSSHAPKQQDSNQSLPSASNNMGIALQYNDRGNTRRTCVQEAILAATGVISMISRDRSSWPRPVQYLFSRIAHLGVLHNRLREFIDPSSGLMPEGLMTSGLETAIRDELTEYYRDLAIWDTEEKDGGSTLRRVAVWAQEPLHRLRWLADITHAARHKKGGELASCVHFFLHHGDERVVTIARSVLNMLVKPLLHMIYVWLTEGEIYDPFSEFFIETIDGVPIDRMWHDKYRVRESMLPSFISGEQAAQILVTGKSVAFMRAACGNEPTPGTSSHLVRMLYLLEVHEAYVSCKVADEVWWEADWLRESVSKAHASVSVRLLDALSTHHHLLDHLAAHRRYLLLAQGDFVDYLLTLVQKKLERPAKHLFWGDLKCSLDVALEATTAQFEPPQVLDRIDVELYRGEGEDNGWDVFALKYRVDGPLGALFPAACVASYRALFAQLWRVKRVEFTLQRAWSDHAFLQKRLKAMPEVTGLMLHVSCLRAAALQLMGALQAASCESAEAEWAELLAAAAARAHLDRLLALHQRALDRHSILAMLHHTTEELRAYLDNVLNDNLALRSFEMSLHDGIIKELDRRDQLKQLKAERLSRGESIESGANAAQDDDMKNRKIFAEFLSNKKADLNVWARSYGDHVTTLILKLSMHPEASFQALAFRLDYNDFYKRDNAELQEPLTYRYKRLSLMGHTSAQE